MIGLEKRARSSAAAAGLSLGEVFAEFLEPLMHHAVRLRGVYDPLLFEQATAFDVPVWRCAHAEVAAYLSRAAAGAKACIDDGKLSRVTLCFFDEERRRTDEVCVRFAALPKVDERSAPLLHSWFREALLGLESRVAGLAPAASFQAELVCAGRLAEPREWVLVEGRGGSGSSTQVEPAVVEPVRSMGQVVPAEVFVKRFLS
jgi:hypothetical protein